MIPESERALAATSPGPITIIEPLDRQPAVDLDECWRFRDLLYFLTWRDVKVRYKQTLLGVAWAILVPLTQMAIFGVIFGKIAKLPSDGLDPFLFYLAALVPWQYFAGSLGQSSASLVNSAHLLTKIYFPRLFIPLAVSLAGLVDFAIAFMMLLAGMLWLGIVPAPSLLLIPVLLVLTLATSLGAGLMLSALNVKYRDVKFVVPFLIQIWMYASVLLPFSKLPESWGPWRYLYGLNPMAGIIESFRWCLLHHEMSVVEPPWTLLAMGLPTTAGLLLFGFLYFQRTERLFADRV